MSKKIENKLEQTLKQARLKKGFAFVPYLAVAEPDWQASETLVDALIATGADSIELGLPFTDPSADGPILQQVFKDVLNRGFLFKDFLNFLERIHAKHPGFPFIVMGYANVFYRRGFQKTLKELESLNVAAVVIPDLTPEEKNRILKTEKISTSIAFISFVTLTTEKKRMQKLAREASGFIYLVSTKGVTGTNQFNPAPLKPVVKTLRKYTDVPVLVGFGIRNRDNVLAAAGVADGVIIGTRIHETINRHKQSTSDKSLPEELSQELSPLVEPINV